MEFDPQFVDQYNDSKLVKLFLSHENKMKIINAVRKIVAKKHKINIGYQSPALLVDTIFDEYTQYIYERGQQMRHGDLANMMQEMFKESLYFNSKDNMFYGKFGNDKADDEFKMNILSQNKPRNFKTLAECLQDLNVRAVRYTYRIVLENIGNYFYYHKLYNTNNILLASPFVKMEAKPDMDTYIRRRASGFNHYLFDPDQSMSLDVKTV